MDGQVKDDRCDEHSSVGRLSCDFQRQYKSQHRQVQKHLADRKPVNAGSDDSCFGVALGKMNVMTVAPVDV